MVLDPCTCVDVDTLDRLSQHFLLGAEGAYGAKAIHSLSEMAGGRVIGDGRRERGVGGDGRQGEGGGRRKEEDGRLDGFTGGTTATPLQHQIHHTYTNSQHTNATLLPHHT